MPILISLSLLFTIPLTKRAYPGTLLALQRHSRMQQIRYHFGPHIAKKERKERTYSTTKIAQSPPATRSSHPLIRRK